MTSAFENYLRGPISPDFLGEPVAERSQTYGEALRFLRHPDKAVEHVFIYVKNRLEKTDTHVNFTKDDVYVVSFMYILHGWKAMVSTTLADGMYYEVTYNKNDLETYIDAYKKWDNVKVSDDEAY